MWLMSSAQKTRNNKIAKTKIINAVQKHYRVTAQLCVYVSARDYKSSSTVLRPRRQRRRNTTM